jgi:predicted molibdopterin-dependent oxidoreductase YjgC
MFRRLHEPAAAAVRITVDGHEVLAREGESVAAAMLAAGIETFRTTPVSGSARAPYCMMGACFDCLVAIDGAGSRPSCLVVVKEGMKIATQRGKRDPGR